LTVFILLVGVSVISFGCADRIILGGNHDDVNPGSARPQVIRVEGRAAQCWIARSPGAISGQEPEAFVLFFVGKSDRADRWVTAVASAWGQHPVEVWGMNYPGSGGSDGPVKLASVSPSALAVYDAVKALAGPRPIFIHAGSFGTTVGLHVAAQRPIAGLVLQNPPPLRQLILGYYGWWNLWAAAGPLAMCIPPELDSLANAARVTAPAIFISAGGDTIIPASYHHRVIDAYAGPKRIIEMPGAGHDTPLTREAAEQFAKDLEWLWSGGQNDSKAYLSNPGYNPVNAH
jgi:alpha-beta hydrolase superfamily lysophospholipase